MLGVPGIKLRRTDTTLDLSSWEPRSDNLKVALCRGLVALELVWTKLDVRAALAGRTVVISAVLWRKSSLTTRSLTCVIEKASSSLTSIVACLPAIRKSTHFSCHEVCRLRASIQRFRVFILILLNKSVFLVCFRSTFIFVLRKLQPVPISSWTWQNLESLIQILGRGTKSVRLNW